MSRAKVYLVADKAWHGQPHPENGKPDNGGDAFYFVAVGPEDTCGRLSGYLNREQFDWLAGLLNVSTLEQVQPSEWQI